MTVSAPTATFCGCHEEASSYTCFISNIHAAAYKSDILSHSHSRASRYMNQLTTAPHAGHALLWNGALLALLRRDDNPRNSVFASFPTVPAPHLLVTARRLYYWHPLLTFTAPSIHDANRHMVQPGVDVAIRGNYIYTIRQTLLISYLLTFL